MNDAGILACSQSQLVGAVDVLQVQGSVDVLDDGLGGGQKISGIIFEPKQGNAGLISEFANWRREDFVGRDEVHAAPPAMTRSEVLLRRLSTSKASTSSTR
jgi:hypothetical protein